MTWQRSGKVATEWSSLAISAAGSGWRKTGQAEGGLGDEQVAWDRQEGGAGRVGLALVVAGIDGPAATVLDHDLGRAQHVAGGGEPDGGFAEGHGLAIGQRLRPAGHALAEPGRHDRQGLRGRQRAVVAGPGVIGMAVADHGGGHGPERVDEEVARPAVEPLGADLEPGPRERRVHRARGDRRQ